MNSKLDCLLKKALEELITPNKRKHIERVLAGRTRHLVVVLENFHKPHNASAVLRSMECFGIQDYYIVESRKQYRISPHVAKGAGKWIDIHRYREEGGEGTAKCMEELHSKGYKICITTPGREGLSSAPLLPEEVPLEDKMALVFGNELHGVSETALQAADLFIRVPMWGFTNSYNVSVCAAMVFYTLLNRLEKSQYSWRLSPDERESLRMQWYRKIISRADVIEKEILKTLPKE